jgi:hypothetical protein
MWNEGKLMQPLLSAGFFLAASLSLFGGQSFATSPKGEISASCSQPEYRQFDFWAGEWISYDPHSVEQGRLSVTFIQGACALREQWTGAGPDGGTGESLSIYDRNRKVWNQTWVSSHGSFLPLEGHAVGNTMVLIGPRVEPDGQVSLQRTIWTPLPGGDVRQVWDQSLDGGQHWHIVYDGLLKPARPNRQ